jgi:hypothetical protein
MKRNLGYILRRPYIYICSFLFVLFSLLIARLISQKANPNWKLKATEHFLIYYEKGSPAEKDIEVLAGLLEKYFTESTLMFGLQIQQKIPYYFHSNLDVSVWGYATDTDIHAIYSDSQKDSSPHELRHFMHRRANPGAPYFFNEGACGFGVEIGGVDFHSRVRLFCADLSKYSLVELVKDFKKYARLGDYLAYSFNSFLIEQYGTDKFAHFYKEVTAENWQGLMERIYGLPVHEIETQWKDFLCPQ